MLLIVALVIHKPAEVLGFLGQITLALGVLVALVMGALRVFKSPEA
jgi:hypothetical protein